MKLIVANWKMQLDVEESVGLASELKGMRSKDPLILCPSYDAIYMVAQELRGSNVLLGAQNVAAYERGAYTGEVSAEMLSHMGVSHVIIGHSERRKYFDENNAIIEQKIKLAIKNNVIPILCIGESRQERRNKKTKTVLRNQLSVLKNIPKTKVKDVLIAYEPIWAIGDGKTKSQPATVEDIESVHNYIKEAMQKLKGVNPRVLYGGSCRKENAKEILSLDSVDGVLVGGESIHPDKLHEMSLF